MKRQQGFTLIELVVVIVILGILAAVALPRFINLTGDARYSAVQGIAAGLRSGVALVQARYEASGATGSSVTMADGTSVTVGTSGTARGVPVNTSAGIGTVMRCESGTQCQGVTIDLTASPSTWRPANAPAACQATYDPATGNVTTPASAAACN